MWLKYFFWFAGPLSPFSFTMLYSKGEFYNPMWLNLLFCICELHAQMSSENLLYWPFYIAQMWM